MGGIVRNLLDDVGEPRADDADKESADQAIDELGRIQCRSGQRVCGRARLPTKNAMTIITP